MDFANNFYNYVNHLVYSENITLLAAIRTYLLDNNIPVQYKQMNCIYDTVHVISNRYINEMNTYNNYININNENNVNNVNNHGLTNDMIQTLTLIQEVQNLMMYNVIH